MDQDTRNHMTKYRIGFFDQQFSPCTTKYQTLCSYVLQQKLCVQNPTLTLSTAEISTLSSILNAMIPLCEPASAQKTGLEHNVWYLVVQGDF